MTITELRDHALRIFSAALRAADPVEAVLRHLRVENGTLFAADRPYPLDSFDRIYVTGAGKASAAMAVAVERLLGERIASGLLNVKYGHTAELRRVRLNECGHPVPDEAGVRGAQRIAGMASEATARDLVICVISGGASALLPLPAPGITLEMKQQTTQRLLASGATIHEINAVRKHISAIKGGRLAELASPATVVSLILSDVIGNDLDTIGSGTTAPDPSTFETAYGVLEKFGITGSVPQPVVKRLRAGMRGELPETPKPGAALFERTQNVIVGSNDLALDAAAASAREAGFTPLILSSFIEGETREIAKMHAAIGKELAAFNRPVPRPACIISGGETTVTLRGPGRGGRNQEFALAAAIDLQGWDGLVVLSGGTDGTDGPTEAAGAICDSETVRRGAALHLDAAGYLRENDSYPYLDATGDLIRTGPTGTNVMDVRLLLAR